MCRKKLSGPQKRLSLEAFDIKTTAPLTPGLPDKHIGRILVLLNRCPVRKNSFPVCVLCRVYRLRLVEFCSCGRNKSDVAVRDCDEL